MIRSNRRCRWAVFVAIAALLAAAPPASSWAAITWDISFDDPGSTYQAYYQPIQSNLTAVLNEYSSVLVSKVPSNIQIDISFSASVTRSTGYSATSVFVKNVGGTNVYEQSVANEIRTGVDPNGSDPDLILKFQPSYLTGELWFDPSPQTRSVPVPANKTDAYSVLLHELTHAFGFNGWRSGTTGAAPGSPPYESTFDQWETFDGTNLFFTGPAAEASYGGPVPVTFGNNWHIGNAAPRPGSDLLPDLMNGVVFQRGARYDISPLDRAILSDAGVAVTVANGDFNGDGIVDAADYTVWRDSLGMSGIQPYSLGDADGNGEVNQLDYGIWKSQFGQPSPAQAFSSSQSVPEPRSVSIALVAACGGILLAAGDIVRHRDAN